METCARCGKQISRRAVPLWLIEGMPPKVIGKVHSGCLGWKSGPGFQCQKLTAEQALEEYKIWKAKVDALPPIFFFRIKTNRGYIYCDVEAGDTQEARYRVWRFLQRYQGENGTALQLRSITPLKKSSGGKANVTLLKDGSAYGNEQAWRMLGQGLWFDVFGAVLKAESEAPKE